MHKLKASRCVAQLLPSQSKGFILTCSLILPCLASVFDGCIPFGGFDREVSNSTNPSTQVAIKPQVTLVYLVRYTLCEALQSCSIWVCLQETSTRQLASVGCVSPPGKQTYPTWMAPRRLYFCRFCPGWIRSSTSQGSFRVRTPSAWAGMPGIMEGSCHLSCWSRKACWECFFCDI